MPSAYRLAFIAAGVAMTTGCILPTNPTCTTEVVPALLVDVRDSSTNALAGRGARIIARTGTLADTARETDSYDGPYGVAPERAGTYTLTVEQAGYVMWSRSGIAVQRGECHVHTVKVTARLQR